MAIDAVAIAEHVEALLHGDDISKTNAALKIWLSLSAAESSSDAKEQQLVVAMAGAIPLLVRLVRSGSDSAKCNASGALAKLTAVHIREEVCTAIAAAGGVAALVSLLREGGDRSKSNALAALANLANDSDERMIAITTAGALPPAIELARSGGDKAASLLPKAASLLQNLACHKDNGVAIALAGGIPVLVALAESGPAGARAHAAAALENLAQDVDIELRIATTRGTAALVDMARHGGVFVDDAAKDAAARLLAERRRVIVHKCVDGKVPAELEATVAAYLSRRGYS